MTRLSFKPIALLLFGLMLFWASHLPPERMPRLMIVHSHNDKAQHLIGVAAFTLLLLWVCGARTGGCAAAAYCIVDEVSQPSFGRTFDWLDLLTDACAIVLVLGCAAGWSYRRRVLGLFSTVIVAKRATDLSHVLLAVTLLSGCASTDRDMARTSKPLATQGAEGSPVQLVDFDESTADLDRITERSTTIHRSNTDALPGARLSRLTIKPPPKLEVRSPLALEIETVGDRLARAAPPVDVVFRFDIIHDQQPRMYHSEEGHVLVTTGLLNQLRDSEELAALLASELAKAIHEAQLAASDVDALAVHGDASATATRKQSLAAVMLQRAGFEPGRLNLAQDRRVFDDETLAANPSIGSSDRQ